MNLGLTPDQMVELVKTVGPVIASILGAIVVALLSAIGWGLRLAWKIHNRRLATMTKALEALAKASDHNKDGHESEQRRIWEALQSLRAEIALERKSHEGVTRAVFNLEGVVKSQQGEIKESNGLLRDVVGQLKALWRFVDAPKRPTDNENGGGEPVVG